MIADRYAWPVWSLVLLVVWCAIFAGLPRDRNKMWKTSLLTMPFGLTEPLFVPQYWNPPSLFNLAQRTGFDVESLIFAFAVGGICAVLYDILIGRRERHMGRAQRLLPQHRLHALTVITPLVVFTALAWGPWNPIYPAIAALFAGAATAVFCRPDLKKRTWLGAALFVLLYIFVLQGLRATSPGYIEHVWNLRALSGIEILGMPLEELLFAASFGAYWSSVYEHMTWRQAAKHIAFGYVHGPHGKTRASGGF